MIGLADFAGRGVHHELAAGADDRLRGRRVVVTGDDRAAALGALELARSGARVRLHLPRRLALHRLPLELLERMWSTPNLSVYPGSEIVACDGVGRLECVVVRDRRGRTDAHALDDLFILRSES